MKALLYSYVAISALALAAVNAKADGVAFGAYYTKLQKGPDWEAYSRTGDYADIVVRLSGAGGELVFWRGNSYLPYWKTQSGQWNFAEIVSRGGDGAGPMTDRANVYSHVAIITNTPAVVVVHWRYLSNFTAGNPHGKLSSENFVDEVFTITPDGRVERVVKKGTEKIAAWQDPLNQTTQVLQLTPEGVKETSRTDPRYSSTLDRVAGNPRKGRPVVKPALWFKFDEGVGDSTEESVTKTSMLIPGPKTYWKKGVSGTALEYDGYNTAVALPAAKAPALAGGSLTLEGWFALGAYPWNWAPIVQQGDNDGYFLGVDSHGYPGFMVKVDGKWEQLSVSNKPPYTDANHLTVFRWYQVAGSYNKTDGMMRLYVNGNEIASKSIGTGGMETTNAEVRVGKAGILGVPTENTHDTLPSNFGIDGLIDEVRIYNVALSKSQVAESYKNFNPGLAIVNAPDMAKRRLPVAATEGKFGAIYTHLPYYETWDNLFRFGAYPDVVVGFDRVPTKFVFWRGVSFIPMMVNESNQWFTEEFNETGFTPDAPGDCEPMSDKACYDSHARVLENTPARVVVEWRYRLANPDHYWANYDAATGWGDIADWYYYIYPDGVATKLMRCYTSKPDSWYEWDEQIAVLSPGQHPETVIRKTPVMTLVDGAGKSSSYDWNPNPPNPDYPGSIIQMIHFTGQYSPFAIQNFDRGDIYRGERNWYSVFPSWNHWPIAQINSSGRNASFPDRAAHSSISHVFWPYYATQDGKVPFLDKILMEGMTDLPAVSLTNLAKSWLHAPHLEALTDCRSADYDSPQRAYVLAATGPAPSFRLAASAEQPVCNPCFVVRNWNACADAQVEVNGTLEPAGPKVRQGIVLDANGRPMLVVWLERESTTPLTITLRGAKPEVASAQPQASEWAVPPQLVANASAVTMTAATLPGVGNQYYFECTADPGHNSGWVGMPRYTDAGLPSETELSYRVKARDAYLNETPWSRVERIRTPVIPPPVVWSMDDSSETTVSDSTGQHEGVIYGPVEWVPGVRGKAMHLNGQGYAEIKGASQLHSSGNFTWAAWLRTTNGGAIIARAGAGREYQPGGKAMFVEKGRLRFDIGWAGTTTAETRVADGKWHHVAVAASMLDGIQHLQCFVDGRLAGGSNPNFGGADESQLPVRIGFCNENFPLGQSGFIGDLDDVRWYEYALSAEQIAKLASQRQE
jgi:hypothetical protein